MTTPNGGHSEREREPTDLHVTDPLVLPSWCGETLEHQIRCCPDAPGPSYAGVGPLCGGVWNLKSVWF